MADVSAWSSDLPSGNSSVRRGDDLLRKHWGIISDTFEEEHFFEDSSASGGIHKQGSARPYVGPASQASTSADDGRLLIATDSDQLFALTSASVRTYPAVSSEATWTQPQGFLDIVRSVQNADNVQSFNARVSGDTIARWAARADGRLEWGSGATTRDTNLYRESANTLATDDNVHVGSDLSVDGDIGFNTLSVGGGVTINEIVSETTAISQTMINSGERANFFIPNVSSITQGDPTFVGFHEGGTLAPDMVASAVMQSNGTLAITIGNVSQSNGSVPAQTLQVIAFKTA